jgi:outer membrane protein
MSMPPRFQRKGRPGHPCSLKRTGSFSLLLAVAALSIFSTAAAQGRLAQPDFSSNPEWFPRIYKPYVMKRIPEVQLSNSASLLELIHDGKLRISLAQLNKAVDDNNLDLMLSRNSARYAETDMLRAKGGGAPRGGAGVQIPSSLFAGAIGTGVGGGGGLGGFGGAGGISGGARQVYGLARGSYDPSIAIGLSTDRTTSPLNSIVVSGLPQVATSSTALQARYSQAFTNGASLSISFNNMRQDSTQRFLLYNPDFVSQLSIGFTQQLLNGFGRDIGRRFIEVANNETKIMKEIVRAQVNTSLAQAQNTYWNLVAAGENVRVAEESLSVAQRFYEDNRKREEIGTVSGLDVVTADSEVASRQRDLVTAQAALQMSEVDLKNVISKNLAEIVGQVQIEPTDALPDPKDSDIPKLNDALATAMSSRSEIRQGSVNLSTQDIAIKYEKNLLKPSLLVFANFNSSGLYGNRVIRDAFGNTIVMPGGISQAFRQVRSWTYPEYAFGLSFSINIHNSAALADSYRAKREKQQTETALQRTRNSIALEVRKAIIGLVQSKAQVEAAHEAVELSRQTLAAEEIKLMEGASIPYEVIRRQRDYSTARFAEVQAKTNYAKALVERDRSMGMLAPAGKD